jgi:hypothetical protein
MPSEFEEKGSYWCDNKKILRFTKGMSWLTVKHNNAESDVQIRMVLTGIQVQNNNYGIFYSFQTVIF